VSLIFSKKQLAKLRENQHYRRAVGHFCLSLQLEPTLDRQECLSYFEMKINIIGGGPAGMYFAILMKKADAAHDVAVYERNGPDDTFGWGVVFSGKTLANLRAADEESHAEITRSFAAWENVDVVHRGEKISIHGNSFSGIARLQLLKILQRRCELLGIELLFHTEIADLESLRADCDLLVAADGVNSTARKQYADRFEPSLDFRPNRYIWYGTHQLFHGLTLTFRENEAGVYAAHSYKFNQTTSTFIIECDPQTWDAAGFAKTNDDETRQNLEKVFGRDLAGQPLLSNNSKWLNFLLVKNANWSFENAILLGDALHTAHFSIGSGTKLALEDAIALFESFKKKENVRAALDEFETTRKPVIEAYQAAAQDSMRWFEKARDYMHLTPIELAYSLMTRSGRVGDEDLKRRDPKFIARYEAEKAVGSRQ
jgi:anthraniloyl-CoA monooxygenase